jgi:uncharacterized membrane protein
MLDNIPTRHRQNNETEKKDFFKLRNILNIIFMIGAVVGIIIYFAVGHDIGIIIVLIAMVFKIVESSLRILH